MGGANVTFLLLLRAAYGCFVLAIRFVSVGCILWEGRGWFGRSCVGAASLLEAVKNGMCRSFDLVDSLEDGGVELMCEWVWVVMLG